MLISSSKSYVLIGGLLTHLIGKHEDVVVLELEGVVVALFFFFWTDELLDSATHPGKHPGKRTEKEKGPGVIINNVRH